MVARNEEGVAILTKHPVVMKQRNHHHSGDVPAPMSETNTNAEGVGASAANGHNQDHAVDVGVNYRLMPRWLQDKRYAFLVHPCYRQHVRGGNGAVFSALCVVASSVSVLVR